MQLISGTLALVKLCALLPIAVAGYWLWINVWGTLAAFIG